MTNGKVYSQWSAQSNNNTMQLQHKHLTFSKSSLNIQLAYFMSMFVSKESFDRGGIFEMPGSLPCLSYDRGYFDSRPESAPDEMVHQK